MIDTPLIEINEEVGEFEHVITVKVFYVHAPKVMKALREVEAEIEGEVKD